MCTEDMLSLIDEIQYSKFISEMEVLDAMSDLYDKQSAIMEYASDISSFNYIMEGDDSSSKKKSNNKFIDFIKKIYYVIAVALENIWVFIKDKFNKKSRDALEKKVNELIKGDNVKLRENQVIITYIVFIQKFAAGISLCEFMFQCMEYISPEHNLLNDDERSELIKAFLEYNKMVASDQCEEAFNILCGNRNNLGPAIKLFEKIRDNIPNNPLSEIMDFNGSGPPHLKQGFEDYGIDPFGLLIKKNKEDQILDPVEFNENLKFIYKMIDNHKTPKADKQSRFLKMLDNIDKEEYKFFREHKKEIENVYKELNKNISKKSKQIMDVIGVLLSVIKDPNSVKGKETKGHVTGYEWLPDSLKR